MWKKLQTSTANTADTLQSFRDTVKEASVSSEKLAAALNGFTRALVIVGVTGLLLQALYVAFYIWIYFHPNV